MQASEVLDLMRKRRTVRKFKSDPVNDEVLQALLEAASVAPSRLDRRPLHFVVIRDGRTKTKLAEALRVRPYIEQAPVVVAVCGSPSVSNTWELDASAAIENMLLAATALGLGGAWVGSKGSVLWDDAVHALRTATAIPGDVEIASLACFGYPDEAKRPYEPGEKQDASKVHYDHWDNLRV